MDTGELPRAGNNGLAERGELRRELLWEGFGMVAPGLFAHPQTEARAAHDILEKLGIPDKALVLSARDQAGAGGLPIASLAGQCWNLDEVADQYRLFSRNFGPVEKLLDPPPPRAGLRGAGAVAAQLAAHRAARSAAAHPMEPDGWPGNAARALCRRIYWQVFDASERHLDAVAGRENARYRPAQADIMGRFGGRP